MLRQLVLLLLLACCLCAGESMSKHGAGYCCCLNERRGRGNGGREGTLGGGQKHEPSAALPLCKAGTRRN